MLEYRGGSGLLGVFPVGHQLTLAALSWLSHTHTGHASNDKQTCMRCKLMNSTGTHCGRLLFFIGMTSLFDHFFKEKHCAVKMGLVLNKLSCHFIKQEKKRMQPTAERGDMKMNRRLSGSSSFSSSPRHPLTAAAVAQPTIPPLGFWRLG